jgi:hypothetical protein
MIYPRFLCWPLQSGAVAVCLQAQNATLPDFCAVQAIGVMSVLAWEPSQKGWFSLSPQAHQ